MAIEVVYEVPQASTSLVEGEEVQDGNCIQW